LTCKFDADDKVTDIMYLGAISNIRVLGNNDEGKIGGIASGKSLSSLGHLLNPDQDTSKVAFEIPQQSNDEPERH
jgi:hypothetical protein